jgi:DNA-binding MarR family transcriptional regulator
MEFENVQERVTEESAVKEEPAVTWEPVQPRRARCNFWLQSADRRFAKNFAQFLAKCGLIASEWAALQELYSPQWRSPVELGRILGMSKGGASKLVSRLVKKGLVDKRTSKSDRRFRSVGLTRQGREFVVRLAPLEKAADREFFRALGNTGRFRLSEWMKRLLDPGRLERLDQWVSQQLQEREFIRFDPDARAKAAAEARAKADALWDYLQRMTEAVLYGKPPPSGKLFGL